MLKYLSELRFALRLLFWKLRGNIKVVRLYDRSRSYAMAIPPFGKRTYIAIRLPEGRFRLSVDHSDSFLQENAKSLYARIRIPGYELRKIADAESNFHYTNDQGLFVYLGGKTLGEEDAARNFEFSIDGPRGYIRFDIVSLSDRFINLDEFKLERVREESELLLGFDQVQHLLSSMAGLEQASCLIYADIDLNVVDGSSIWLSSMVNILSKDHDCVVLSKSNIASDIITSNIEDRNRVYFITPFDLGLTQAKLSVGQCISIIEQLDDALPRLRRVVVRGLEAAVRLHSTRQFASRSVVYLTDFYKIENNLRVVSDERHRDSRMVMRQTDHLLAQTSEIADALNAISGVDKNFTILPPPIPDNLPMAEASAIRKPAGRPLRIGYAGKISPYWGVEELFEWANQLHLDGIKVEIVIVANKISAGALDYDERMSFINRMKTLVNTRAIKYYSDLNREGAMSAMMDVDLVWCYRPPVLEENTLELSTKLVEMVACNKPCICYPNKQNIESLGEDYPYFIRNYEQFRSLLSNDLPALDSKYATRIRERHSVNRIQTWFSRELIQPPANPSELKFLYAVHDTKFSDAFVSSLKDEGLSVRKDRWNWGTVQDLERSEKMLQWADVIFCEWGLANAVWYADHNASQKPLYVRMHLQEIKERARKFGAALNIEQITKVIFVSEAVRDEAVKMWNWPVEKTVVIPNYVLDNEYLPVGKPKDLTQINLGMVGIIPQRKRFDRAVETLKILLQKGIDANLYIKGPRPEELDFMRAPGRAGELVYYNEVYNRITADHALKGRVHFEPWGNDVALWYEKIDAILSCSDFESFHYALADGVLSGCLPLIWPWNEADKIYTADWIVNDAAAAAERIVAFMGADKAARENEMTRNRSLVASRYGREIIFEKLKTEMRLN